VPWVREISFPAHHSLPVFEYSRGRSTTPTRGMDFSGLGRPLVANPAGPRKPAGPQDFNPPVHPEKRRWRVHLQHAL
jgi:hypothetical protein